MAKLKVYERRVPLGRQRSMLLIGLTREPLALLVQWPADAISLCVCPTVYLHKRVYQQQVVVSIISKLPWPQSRASWVAKDQAERGREKRIFSASCSSLLRTKAAASVVEITARPLVVCPTN